jgi:hypothetical protein
MLDESSFLDQLRKGLAVHEMICDAVTLAGSGSARCVWVASNVSRTLLAHEGRARETLNLYWPGNFVSRF